MDKMLVRESLLGLFGAFIHKFPIMIQQYTVYTFKHKYTRNIMQQQLMRRWRPQIHRNPNLQSLRCYISLCGVWTVTWEQPYPHEVPLSFPSQSPPTWIPTQEPLLLSSLMGWGYTC